MSSVAASAADVTPSAAHYSIPPVCPEARRHTHTHSHTQIEFVEVMGVNLTGVSVAKLPHSAATVNVPLCQWLSLSPGPVFLGRRATTRQTGGGLSSFLRAKTKQRQK